VVNTALTGRFHISPQASPVFVLARWIDFGAVPALLEERCAVEPYALCPHRAQLRHATSPWFLFAADSPLQAIGGLEHSRAAVWPMLRDTLRFQLAQVVWGTLKRFGAQLLVFRTGVMHVAYDESTSVTKAIRMHYPQEYERWQGSLQQHALLADVGRGFSWVHVPVALAGLVFLCVVALPAHLGWASTVAPTSRFLARAVLSFVLINAAVCAAFASTVDRYQSRVIWLVALVAIEILARERFSRPWRRPPRSRSTSTAAPATR